MRVSDLEDLERRVRRVEAHEEIRQLASAYAVALDRRDVAAMVALFVEDVDVGNGSGAGTPSPAGSTRCLRPYRTTFHLIGNHVIDLLDDDHATGIVYCRPSTRSTTSGSSCRCSTGTATSARTASGASGAAAGGLLRGRRARAPAGVEGRFHFPGNPMIHRAELPGKWETWRGSGGSRIRRRAA